MNAQVFILSRNSNANANVELVGLRSNAHLDDLPSDYVEIESYDIHVVGVIHPRYPGYS